MKSFPQTPAPRKKRHLRVSFGFQNPTSQGLTLDMSETGAFICTRQLFDTGMKLRLLLETPMGNFALEGRVVWSCDETHPPRSPHEPGMGLRWVATDDQFLDFFNMI